MIKRERRDGGEAGGTEEREKRGFRKGAEQQNVCQSFSSLVVAQNISRVYNTQTHMHVITKPT